MPIDSSAGLIETLRRLQLLDPAQLGEIARGAPAFPDPRALAKELLHRAWLTPYQVNQLFQDRGGDLVLGQYVIQERLGEGGMGQVFKAQQRRLNRVVALKVIRKDRLANPEAVRRFHREIQAVAQLSHPNVVVAYDADQVGQSHFFAMEYVEGTDLARLVRESGPLPPVFACDYMRQAALGLQHAHERGLVHRDIKPSNLLIAWAASRRSKVPAGAGPARAAGEVTGRPVVKILDMGLARLEGDDDATSQLTQEGSVMGTLDYLAPEQAQNSRLADIRSDLYSLGCTFYFALTGQVPFPGGTATEKLLRHRLDEAPAVDKVRSDVPPGVAAVIGKLMAKKPEDRFQTPAELADALAVPLNGIGAGIGAGGKGKSALKASPQSQTTATAPVAILVPGLVGTPVAAALPITANGEETLTSGRFPRLVKAAWPRWKWIAAGAGLSVAMLVLVLLVRPGSRKNRPPLAPLPSAEQTTEADLKRLKNRLEEYAADPEQVRRYLLDVRRAHAGAPESLLAAELLGQLPSPLDQFDPRKLSSADRTSAGQPDGLVAVFGDQRLRHWAGGRQVSISPDGRLGASCGADSIIRLWDLGTGNPLRQFPVPQGGLWASFRNDGKRLAGIDGGGNLKLWDTSSGREIGVPPGRFLAYAPDNETVALLSPNNFAQVRLIHLASGKERLTFAKHTGPVHTLSFAPDGHLAATGSRDMTVLVWDTETGTVRSTFKGHAGVVTAVHFVADGKAVLSYDNSGTVKLWDSATVNELASFANHSILGKSANGKIFALLAPGGAAKLFDAATGKERATLKHESAEIACLAFSPNGQLVVTGSMNSGDSLKIWDLTTGMDRAPPRGSAGEVVSLALSGDGNTLITASTGGTLRIWDTATLSQRLQGQPEWYSAVQISPDSKMLALTWGNLVQLWDTAKDKPATLSGHQGPIGPVVFSADGLTLATSSRDSVVKLWDVASGQVQSTLRHGQFGVASLSFLPDGRALASTEWSTVKLWDTVSGQPRAVFDGPKSGVGWSATAPDGKTLAMGNQDGTLILWDVASKKSVRTLSGFKGAVQPAYSPDGRFLAARGYQDGVVKVWDTTTNKEVATIPPSSAWAINPDSRTMATAAGEDGQLRVWDAATGQLKTPLEGHTGRIDTLSYAPDGQLLASAGQDGRVIVWEPSARKRKMREWQLPGQILRVVFAPDGRHIAAVNGNGTVYILRLGPPQVKSGQ